MSIIDQVIYFLGWGLIISIFLYAIAFGLDVFLGKN